MTKSVKFELKKYTREISDENKIYNEYEDDIPNLTDENTEKNDKAVERKQLFSEETEEAVAPKKRISNVYKNVNFGSNIDSSSDDETSNKTM